MYCSSSWSAFEIISAPLCFFTMFCRMESPSPCFSASTVLVVYPLFNICSRNASLTVSPGLSTTDFYALRAIVVRGMDRHIDVIAGAARFQRIVHENPDRIDQFKFTRPAAAHGIRNMKMNRHPLLCGLAVFVVQKGGQAAYFQGEAVKREEDFPAIHWYNLTMLRKSFHCHCQRRSNAGLLESCYCGRAASPALFESGCREPADIAHNNAVPSCCGG